MAFYHVVPKNKDILRERYFWWANQNRNSLRAKKITEQAVKLSSLKK